MDDGWNRAGDALAEDIEKDATRSYSIRFLNTQGKEPHRAWRWRTVQATDPLEAAKKSVSNVAKNGANEGCRVLVAPEGSTDIYVYDLVATPPPPRPTPPPAWTVKA